MRIGGDVTHLFSEVLPRLADGVIVHLHDIYLPWSYPRDWVVRDRWYWAEEVVPFAVELRGGGPVISEQPERLARDPEPSPWRSAPAVAEDANEIMSQFAAWPLATPPASLARSDPR